jgi:DNA repair protein RadC
MWERAQSAVYDLPCGVTWSAREQSPGEYKVSLTRGITDTCRRLSSDHGIPAPRAGVLAASAPLARLLDTSTSVTTRLLECYGSLTALRRADPAALCTAHGLSHGQTTRLADALDLATGLLLEPHTEQPQVTGPHDAARLVLPEMGLLEREQMRVLLLTTKNRLIAAITLYHGTTSACQVRVAEILREAVRHNAVALIVVHNHPSGAVEPSPEDVQITRDLVRAGRLLDVNVLDHLVVGKDAYTSLRERGLGWA